MAALKRRKATKESKRQDRIYAIGERIHLECKTGCGNVEVVSPNISAVTCGDCVQKMLAPPPEVKKEKPAAERKPRGWQFMKKYIAPDGKVYSKGKEVIPKKRESK